MVHRNESAESIDTNFGIESIHSSMIATPDRATSRAGTPPPGLIKKNNLLQHLRQPDGSGQKKRAIALNIKAIKPEQIADLQPQAIASLSAKETKMLSAEQIKSLSPEQSKALSAAQIGHMTITQLGAFTPKQMQSLDSRALTLLDRRRLKAELKS